MSNDVNKNTKIIDFKVLNQPSNAIGVGIPQGQ